MLNSFLSIAYTTERMFNVYNAIEDLAVLADTLQATPIQPFLYRNALRPHGFFDDEGYSATPLHHFLEVTRFDKLMQWDKWTSYMAEHRPTQIHGLILEQCTRVGDPVTWSPSTPSWLSQLDHCVHNDAYDWPLETPVVKFLLNTSQAMDRHFDFVIIGKGDWNSKWSVLEMLTFFFLELERFLPVSS